MDYRDGDEFPIQKNYIYLAHCGISPLYSGAARKMKQLVDFHSENGDLLFRDYYFQELSRFKEQTGRMLNTSADNIAVTKNTTEALSMIANGYPFEKGDEIILYENEYPANFYPWTNLENRGVVVRMLRNVEDDRIPAGLSGFWSQEALEGLITPRTRMIVMSHVQFVTGYAADLEWLSRICGDRNIDLVLDAAQSFGALPLDLARTPVSAMAASGWKWTMGPIAISPFYTSPEMRKKVSLTMIGAETMVQGTDFLNHSWVPHETARRYEYSTSPVYQVAGFNECIERLFLSQPQSDIFSRMLYLQDEFLNLLDHPDFTPLVWPDVHRSGILSIYHPNASEVQKYLADKNMVVTARSGFIRLAPHFYNTEEEIRQAADAFNHYPHVEG